MEIKIKRGTSSYLSETNPVLAAGEPCLETDTRRIKYGDGATPWNLLAYANPNVNLDGGELSAPAPSSPPGTFTPPSLEGLTLWLDGASRFEGFVSVVGSGVSQWLDKSAEKNNFFQSLKENRPVNSGTANGLGVVTFDGDNDAMLGSFKLQPQCTVFIVFKRNGSSTNGRVLTGLRADESEFSFCATEDGTSFGVLADGEYLATQEVSDQTISMYSLVVSETSLVTRLNGLSSQTATYSNESRFKSFSVGSSRSNYSSGAYGGDVAEIVVYDRVLTDTERQQVDAYLLGRWGITQTVHPLLNGMVAFWPMNESAGTRADISGNANNLTQTGTVPGGAGVLGSSAAFPGGLNYLEKTGLTLTPSFTISGWFKSPTTTGMVGEFMQNWDGNDNAGQFVLGWGDESDQSNQLWAYVKTNSGIQRLAYNSLAADEWRHFALSLDSATGDFRLYVDNVLADSAPTTTALNTTTTPFRLGIGEQTSAQNSVAAYLDSVGVWDRALPEHEIAMLWNGGFGKEEFTADTYGDNVSLLLHANRLPNAAVSQSLNITSPTAYWKFNDVAGNFIDAVLDQPLTETGGSIDRDNGVAHITDGDSACLTFPAGLCDVGAGQKTFSLWFKLPQAATGYQWIWMQDRSSDYDGCNPFYLENTGFLNCIFTTQQNTWTNYAPFTSTSPTPDVWHHAVVVFDGSTCTPYYDGAQVASFSYSGAVRPSGAATLGRYNAYNPVSLIGGTSANLYIAEIGIWDAALTAEEVTTLFTAGYDTGYTPPRGTPPAISYSTSLLLHFDGANNGTTFTDSSDNALTLTPNGNVVTSTTQSKFGGASAYFDGSSTLTAPNACAVVGDEDFTVECWVYPIPTFNEASYYVPIANDSFGGLSIVIDQYGYVWTGRSLIGDNVISTNTLNFNDWNHIAVSRKNGTTKIFVNGEVGASYSNTPTYAQGAVRIGSDGFGSSLFFQGYMDDLRIVRGKGLYTENFTPANHPLPVVGAYFDVDTTSLLLHFDGSDTSTTFTDSSGNELTATVNGTAAISTAESKFGGASGSFAGSGNSVDFDPSAGVGGSGDFTVEAWIYPTELSGDHVVVEFRGTGDGCVFFVGPDGALGLFNSYPGLLEFSTGTVLPDEWSHIALVKEGSSVSWYINGVIAGAFSVASLAEPTAVRIGDRFDNGAGFIGYIDEVRIIKGTARYTANFTPPTAPFSVQPSVQPSLLLHFNDYAGSTNFVDSSNSAAAVTPVGNVTISDAQYKFGGTSAYFDGYGGYLKTSNNNTFNFGTGDFTIETWIWFNNVYGVQGIICSNDTGGVDFQWNGADGWFGLGEHFVTWAGTFPATVNSNEWYHLSLCRANGVTRVFLNGQQQGYDFVDSAARSFNGTNVIIGNGGINGDTDSGGYALSAYIDDLRVVKGVGLYTENFTPPTRQLPDPVPVAQEVVSPLLLLHFDGANGSTTFIDSSTNAWTAAVNGAAQISTTQSKFGGASGYFDGSSYLSFASTTDFDIGLNGEPFTVELFFNAPQDYSDHFLFARGATVGEWNSTNGLQYALFLSGGRLYWQFLNADTPPGSPSWGDISVSQPTGNEWHHVAVCYDGLNTTIFVDGVASNYATTSAPYYAVQESAPLYVGRHPDPDALANFSGYVDELRVTRGEALYTGNFTPPTAPFPNPVIEAPITYFYDHSKYHHTVTANGDAQLSLTTYKYGNAAGVFDGEGDYLTVPESEAFGFGAGDFTIEYWYYYDDAHSTGIEVHVDTRGSDIAVPLVLGKSAEGEVRCYDGTLPVRVGGSLVSGEWNHIAWSRTSGQNKVYLNGVSVISFAGDFDAGTSRNVTIGTNAEPQYENTNGYIDDLRITKGVGRYTANFTPPAKELPDPIIVPSPVPAGDPYAEYVTLLLHMDGANGSTSFIDNSYLQNVVTANGNAAISTAQSKFGGASGHFSDENSWLNTNETGKELYGETEDFTVECWVRPTNLYNQRVVFGSRPEAPYLDDCIVLAIDTNGFPFVHTNATAMIQSSINVLAGEWTHLAVTRLLGNFYLYVNGVLAGDYLDGQTYVLNADAMFFVGAEPRTQFSGNVPFLGYIDDLRITKGLARYTADFTPPTAAFPDPFVPVSDAALLLHFDGANGSTTFTDSSANGLVVTANGNAVISTSQSKFGGSSGYFDGSSWTDASSSEITVGTLDFTLECWAYPTQLNYDVFSTVVDMRPGGATTGLVLWLNSYTGKWAGYASTNGNTDQLELQASEVATLNQWSHLALVREGTSLMFFVNGNLEVTEQIPADRDFSQSYTTFVRLGTAADGPGYRCMFYGYIDELRMTKGTALYTANFTPPTAPFGATSFNPAVVAGNDLWLDASDSSTVNELGGSITSWEDKSGLGNDAVQYSMYATPSLVASATPNGLPAVHFNGDPNMLEVSNQFDLKDSSGFVVVKQTSQSNGAGYPRILGFQPTTGADSDVNDGLCLVVNQNSGSAIEIYSGGQNCSANVTLPLNWSVIGYTIDAAGTVTLRKDGVEVASFQNTAMTAIAGAELLLGFGGFFWSVEALQGDIAAVVHYDHKLGPAATSAVEKYLANKYLDSGAVPMPSGTIQLLMHFDGNFNDLMGNLTFGTTGSPSHSSIVALPGFGQSADLTAGALVSDQKITIDQNQDFTIEFWHYNTLERFSGAAPMPYVFGIDDAESSSPSPNSLMFFVHDNSRNFFLYSNTYVTQGFIESPVFNQWQHIAVTRQSGTIHVYLDGNEVESAAYPNAITGRVTIGCKLWFGITDFDYSGYVDELRIVKGQAVYTENFTPPTQPFGGPNFDPVSDPHWAQVTYLNRFTASDNLAAWTAPSGRTMPSFETAPGGCPNNTALYATTGIGLYSNDRFGEGGILVDLTQDFTIEMWIYIAENRPNIGPFDLGGVLLRADGGDPFNFSFLDNLNISLGSGSDINVSGTSAPNTLTVGRWHHIAAVSKAGQYSKIFVDGVAVITAGPSTSNGSPAAYEWLATHCSDCTPANSIDLYADVYISNMRITQYARYESNFYPVFVNFPAQ